MIARPLFRRLAAALFLAAAPAAAATDPADWDAVLAAAKGQTVYFHAWGGEPLINAYIAWAGAAVKQRYGVGLVHVKVDDTANVVGRIVAEKAAGRNTGGAVDLVWINGENFAALKRKNLLQATSWAESLPNWRYVDVAAKPAVRSDFTVPTDGLEAPWGMAKLVFFTDTARVADPPRSARDLLAWAKAHPGRFTYPKPPDFMGSTFLKQVLIELTDDPAVLSRPVDPANFDRLIAPLFAYLDDLHPYLWRSGRTFPDNLATLRRLLADGETDIAFAFNPAAASNAIANRELPDTVRSFVFPAGTLGNAHFVAIPYNARSPEGAMVVANFLMSPEAQTRKQDPDVWGDPTVLDVAALAADDRARFDALELGIATLPPEALGPVLSEPHPSWVGAIEQAWAEHYGVTR
jgi:putative thiamine transport system substrate-binding protein